MTVTFRKLQPLFAGEVTSPIDLTTLDDEDVFTELRAGNAHLRRVLVEASWHYRHRPSVGPKLRKRREGQPLAAISIADKAQHRLSRRFQALVARGKPTNKAVVAVARELAGFVWATLSPTTSPATPTDPPKQRRGRSPLPTGEGATSSTRGLRRGATL